MSEANTLSTGHLVEKSKKLVWAKFKDWGAGELRLLDVYLSRIDARNPDSSNVRFTLKEYAELIGVSELRHAQVSASTEKFLGNVVTLRNSSDENEWAMYTLFTTARCFKDKKIGQYMVEIDCNSQLKDVFFNIAQDGYIKYRLQSTIRMKRQYSIKLYGMLLDMMDLPPEKQRLNLEKLREQLDVPKDAYTEFKFFKRDVLDPAKKEINTVSNINMDYERIVEGRKCVGIKFKIYYKSDSDFPVAPPAIEPPKRRGRKPAVNYQQYLPGFTEDDARLIGTRLKAKIKRKYPEIPKDQIDNAVADTLKNAYNALIVENTNAGNIDSEEAYIYATLCGKNRDVGKFIPGKYFPVESYFPKK